VRLGDFHQLDNVPLTIGVEPWLVAPSDVGDTTSILGIDRVSRLWLALLTVSWLLVGCTPTPIAPASTTTLGSPGSSPTDAVGPSVDGVDADPTISTVDDPYAAAVLRVMELGGTPCIREKHVEPDIQSYGLDRSAEQLSGQEGMLAGGKAFVGSLAAAAKGFHANEVLTGSKEGRSVVIMQARDVTDIPEAAPIGYVLLPVALKDGRTAWLRTGDYVASIPCAPESS
jgi:hypothetical protein